MSHKTRKFAGLIASVAVGISLLGAGTYASFTDSATATDNIAVGTMGIKITSTQNGVTTDGKNVTNTAGDSVRRTR